ncbi:acyl-CoA dehydrogenase family protein [Rhodococcus sp. JS3073]|uniref:acyl-CoA dehydrogenase family protein n=1 Tax=Rhodococcus sp. JS3073 TaxID=3002901 RepID=UPI002E23AFF9
MELSSCAGIHADLVAPYLVHLTSEEQKQRWLPRLCSGEMFAATGMTETRVDHQASLKTTTAKDGKAGSFTEPRHSSPTATPPTWW